MIIFIIFVFINIYAIYQGIRALEINLIREKWKEKGSRLQYKHHFEDMMVPNFSNWFGLRWPNKKHYE